MMSLRSAHGSCELPLRGRRACRCSATWATIIRADNQVTVEQSAHSRCALALGTREAVEARKARIADDLENIGDLERYVASASVILALTTASYMRSKNCMSELRSAVRQRSGGERSVLMWQWATMALTAMAILAWASTLMVTGDTTEPDDGEERKEDDETPERSVTPPAARIAVTTATENAPAGSGWSDRAAARAARGLLDDLPRHRHAVLVARRAADAPPPIDVGES